MGKIIGNEINRHVFSSKKEFLTAEFGAVVPIFKSVPFKHCCLVDASAKANDEVDILSLTSGTVKDVGRKTNKGNYIVVSSGKYEVSYMHLKDGTIKVKKGAKVNEGDVLGTMGNTGNTTGRCLSLLVTAEGKPIDPITFMKDGGSFKREES